MAGEPLVWLRVALFLPRHLDAIHEGSRAGQNVTTDRNVHVGRRGQCTDKGRADVVATASSRPGCMHACRRPGCEDRP
jgi:hypothetical protein